MNGIVLSNGVFEGAASPPNATLTSASDTEQRQIFTFTIPVLAAGIINTSPDGDRLEFFGADGSLLLSFADDIGVPTPLDGFLGAIASDGAVIRRMEVTNETAGTGSALELDELIFVPAPAPHWTAGTGGQWTDPANWSGYVPNGIDNTANFGVAISSAAAVTISQIQTVGTLNFNSPISYEVGGSSALIMDVSIDQAFVNVLDGTHTIAAQLILNDDTTFNVSPADSSLIMSGSVTASQVDITKDGDGKAHFSNIRAASLTVLRGTATISPQGLAAGASKVESLILSGSENTWTSVLDLTNNYLAIDYTGTSPLATVRNQIQTGSANGAYSGSGINSSTAAAVAWNSANPHKTGIGYAEASELSISDFGGQILNGDAVLLAYTLLGDADLDRDVDSNDFNRFSDGYGMISDALWTDGDFDHNGKTNTKDFNFLAGNFGESLASATRWAAVPEPTGLASLSPIILLRIRRNRRAVIR